MIDIRSEQVISFAGIRRKGWGLHAQPCSHTEVSRNGVRLSRFFPLAPRVFLRA